MNNPFMKFLFFFIILSFYIAIRINAQPSLILNSSELKIAIEKLNVLGSVLYIGAHPDDENSGIIAYWAKGKKYRTAYLSLTRGDGGQNLIGSEKGSEIGIIRTQELLQARKIDGGEQYFTRAIDFGYSKSPEESLNIWGKNDVLSDMVWVIRKFKPDIIVTRFPPGGNGGHGHHTASAALSLEAFNDAADSTKFPEQLKYVSAWKTKRIFWNNFRPSSDEINNLISTDIGEYNPLLGKSYTEIASESRSMHKSQGVGVSAFRGSRIEYFKLVAGEEAKNDIFDGINTTWDRIDKSKTLSHNIETVIKSFNPDNPSASLDALIKVYDEITKLSNNYWVEVKRKELLSIIQSCAGLWLEAISSDYSASSGDSVKVKTTVLNRSSSKFIIDKIEFPSIPSNSIINKDLKNNQPVSAEDSFTIPESYPISQPYWLKEEPSEGLFSVSDQQMIGLAENPPSILVKIFIKYNDTLLDFSIPLLYRWNDRVYGELYRPFEIRPVATVNPADKVSIFPDEKSKEIQVKLKANSSNISGLLNLHSDGNWKISPSGIPFSI
jgi:LmbE family N-acetylglucosaminyl deacetylase